MNISSPAASIVRRFDARLWALLFGNFVIGTGILLPAGMLSQLSSGLGVTIPVAGWLVLASGIAIGLGAPLAAALTSGIDRKILLLGSLVPYILGNAAASLLTDFRSQLIARVLTVISACIFTPQAAATVALLVPLEKRAGAVAFIFLGWSISLVSGTALAGLIAVYAGWRWGFVMMAVLSVLAFWLVALAIPRGLKGAPLSLASWGRVIGDPSLVLILLVTVASSGGQFVVLTYVGPLLGSLYSASPSQIAAVLTVFGCAGIAGNMTVSRLVAGWGAERLILIMLIAMATGFAVLALAQGILAVAFAAAVLWGFGTFSSNSLQQARLMGRAPPLASASVALNTSAIYSGQAIGPATGGALIASGNMGGLAWVACLFLLAATVLSLLADRRPTRATTA